MTDNHSMSRWKNSFFYTNLRYQCHYIENKFLLDLTESIFSFFVLLFLLTDESEFGKSGFVAI